MTYTAEEQTMGDFYATPGTLIGHDKAAVRDWLLANPSYDDCVILDRCDGSDQELIGREEFLPEADDLFAAVAEALNVQETAQNSHKHEAA